MKVNFYLKNYKAKKTSAIYLDFSYDGYRLQLSAGISINPNHWSKSKAFPKIQINNYDAYREH